MIFELPVNFHVTNSPKTEIRTGASNNWIRHRWYNSVSKGQIIFPNVHIDIPFIYWFSHCCRTSQ